MTNRALPTFALLEDLWATILSKVTQQSNGCCRWEGAFIHGHPAIRVNDRYYRVVPMILEAKLKRPIADNMNTLHTCGDDQCVEPDHLYEGPERGVIATPALHTYARSSPGSRRYSPAGNSRHNRVDKLDEDIVRDIRASTLSDAELALIHKVSKMAIYYARTGKTWKNVSPLPADPDSP